MKPQLGLGAAPFGPPRGPKVQVYLHRAFTRRPERRAQGAGGGISWESATESSGSSVTGAGSVGHRGIRLHGISSRRCDRLSSESEFCGADSSHIELTAGRGFYDRTVILHRFSAAA